jgi:flagellar biosynthesis protein FlhG
VSRAVPEPRTPPLDQADGLRRLFASRASFVAVAANPHVSFAGVMLERIATACAMLGRRVLVVDAADSAPPPHELALLDLPAGIEPLSPQVSYLPARGLPLRHVDARGTMANFLVALRDAAPAADAVIVHAGASHLSRLFATTTVRPLLLAADHPTSVTHAYAAMKLLVQRNGLMAFDLVLAAGDASPRRTRIAEQFARCADSFLGAVLHDWAAVDPAGDAQEAPPSALFALVAALLTDPQDLPALAPSWVADRSLSPRAAP